jgi:hypothetical protein
MASATNRQKKHLPTPVGCEGYFTRQQAAQALGFASEFKIRDFERKGRLRSVRGPMRAAFYPRAEVLALKAQLALSEPGRGSADVWSDAELLALLGHAKRNGDARTALDLVLETQISIERAERVHDFWKRCGPVSTSTHATKATIAPSVADSPAQPEPATSQERRGAARLSRDTLIRNLRDPDPRVREQAFAQLKEAQGDRKGLALPPAVPSAPPAVPSAKSR